MTKQTENSSQTENSFTPVILKHVTMPTLKLLPDVAVFVKIMDEIFKGKVQKAKKDEADKKPPMIFNVINLETGAAMQMVAGKVVESEITESYPEHAYVGKCFMITKGKEKGPTDRSYFTYEIAEIEDPSPTPAKKK